MARHYNLKATLSENVNKAFRAQTRLFNIIHRSKAVENTPIIINNFNRLEYLQKQMAWLQGAGYKNIHVIDNASTYEPLLQYYRKIPATVYRLDRNVGHEAFWRTHLFQRFQKRYYVLTDPDVLPDEAVPEDFLYHFFDILSRYPEFKKVGFGLRIDDLPDHYPKKAEVIRWEQQHFESEVEKGLYKAPIDTTFALYRPGAMFQCWNATLRTDVPYLLRHMPWYEDPRFFTEEAAFYMEHCTSSSSWYQTLKGNDQRY